MPVTDVRTDSEALTLTLTARFDVPPDRVWQVWADPRQLERWWGPPSYPATVLEHHLAPGGLVDYFMTGPQGDKHRGWWRVLVVEFPHLLEFEDGFADESGRPVPDAPTMKVRVRLTEDGEAATVMTIENTFGSTDAMAEVLAMGAVEGMTAAVGQLDAMFVDTGV